MNKYAKVRPQTSRPQKSIRKCHTAPHDLTEDNKRSRMSILNALFSRYNRESFFPHLITGDEKWIFYANMRRKRQWIGQVKSHHLIQSLICTPKRCSLVYGGDLQGPIYWELLDSKVRINALFYTQQLDRLAEAVRQKRPDKTKIIQQHDNAKPHTAKLTKAKIQELG